MTSTFDYLPASYTETLSELIYDVLIDEGEYTPETILTVPIEERIIKAAPYILEDYPIFDESYRDTLNFLILLHYFAREIGSETPELFLFYLNRELREIMPYYNKLYLSETLEYNPLYTVDKTTSHKGDEAKTDKTSVDNTFSRNIGESTKSESSQGFSDTPQGAITGIMDALTPGGSGYLTNAQLGRGSQDTAHNEKEKGQTTGTGTSTSVDNYIDHVTGYEGKPAELIQEYRKTLLNINLDIIDALNGCFMGIY